MSTLPTFETDRLFLRPLVSEDVDLMYAMDSNPKVMQYIGRSRQARTKSEVRTWINRRLPKENGLGTWLGFLKKDKTFVGCYLLIQIDLTIPIEIGYRLKENMWGKGLATEGAARIMAYAFEDLAVKSMAAVAYPEHYASHKVLEKLGMVYLKTILYFQTKVVLYQIEQNQYFTK